MFAVIKTGGKQYKVHEGDVLKVEKLPFEPNSKQKLTDVLCLAKDNDLIIDADKLSKASVEFTVLEQFRDKKIIVFKKKRRKNYRKKLGHRQNLTKILINKINF